MASHGIGSEGIPCHRRAEEEHDSEWKLVSQRPGIGLRCCRLGPVPTGERSGANFWKEELGALGQRPVDLGVRIGLC